MQHAQSTWWHIERAKAPFTIAGATVKIPAKGGRYRIIVGDAWSGARVRAFERQVDNGALAVPLLTIKRDVAIVAVRM